MEGGGHTCILHVLFGRNFWVDIFNQLFTFYFDLQVYVTLKKTLLM